MAAFQMQPGQPMRPAVQPVAPEVLARSAAQAGAAAPQPEASQSSLPMAAFSAAGAAAATAAVSRRAARQTGLSSGRARAARVARRSVAAATEVAEHTKVSERAWRKSGADWEVHKFGGASLETAELYKTCGDLLRSESQRNGGVIPTSAIVSAAGGMTDALVSVVTTSVQDTKEAAKKMDAACQRQIGILLELIPDKPELTDPVIANIKSDAEGVLAMLTAVQLMRSAPPQMLELVAGLGEVWSAQTLSAYLVSAGELSSWVDARDVLIVPDTSSGGLGEKGQALDTIQPMWSETEERLQDWWFKAFGSGLNTSPFVIITGFVCSTISGRPTTLKRSGSDYSATIFAKVLGASSVTMWKNVNGVYTADPRRVPLAFPISKLTFDEAMELAYFGGQVLHPSAMIPCIDRRIPVLVRNVFNPPHPGTRVYGRGDERLRWDDQGDDVIDVDLPVKAITSIEKVALVTLAGASFLGTHGVAKRMMEALSNSSVNVILTSQGSSEHSITVAVDESQAELAAESVKEAFAIELASDSEIRVTSKPKCSILACIGEGMKSVPGISGRFFNALGKAKVNVIAIAQGSSERNISAVVPREDLSRALRAAHAGFTLSDMTVAVGIIGCGKLGGQLMKQLADFDAKNEKNNENVPATAEVKRLHLEVRAVSNEKTMLLAEHGMPLDKVACDDARGVDLDTYFAAIPEREDSDEFRLESSDLAALEDFMDTKRIPHKVLIDCSGSEQVADLYEGWLKRGIHVISANKLAGAGDLERYLKCMQAARNSQGQWCYDSTVGAQLPVIPMLKDILQTGDRVTRVDGIFSGTLGFAFDKLSREPGTKFSEALKDARDRRLTEPNACMDLTGADTARKALIVARELGMELKLEDVKYESVLPKGLPEDHDASSDEGWETLLSAVRSDLDDTIAARMEEANAKGEKLRYIGEVDTKAGTVSVGLRSFPSDHPFSIVRESETVVAIASERCYAGNTPLVLRGPGAGSLVRASGVFADLLRLSRRLSA